MTTSFSELRSLIRSILGDTNSSAYIYTDGSIDNHIRVVVLSEGDSNIEESDPREDPPIFTVSLTARNKAIVVFKAARGIIAGVPDEFAYQTPVLKVKRKGLSRQLLSHIDKSISEIDGMPLSSESEIEAYVNAAERYYDQVTSAIAS